MGYEINWTVSEGDPVNSHPLYLKYSGKPFSAVDASTVKTDIQAALASRESAAIVAYLSWLLRVVALIA